ncbi:MAG: D-glycerate dehydrogenase [Pseudomonadota bacterium]
MRVALSRRWPASVEAQFAKQFELTRNRTDSPLSSSDWQHRFQVCEVVCPTVTDRLTDERLRQWTSGGARTRLLANYGVGYNHIDLDACQALRIAVTNTPDVLTGATAELTVAAMLALVRRLGEGERLVRAGRWQGWAPTELLGTGLAGKTLGILGFGRIGAAVAQRAALGLGMHIRYYSPRPVTRDRFPGFTAEPVATIDELVASVDVLSLHCPSTPETRGLLNAERLARSTPGLFVINTARGDLIDEPALTAALERRQIAGAALDVHAHEPAIHAALLERNDVVLLPHLGSATVAARRAMGERVLVNVQAFADGAELPDRVV